MNAVAQEPVQLDLWGGRHRAAFEAWVHSPHGGHAMNRFIRLAIAANRSGVRVGAKEIWERLRWHYRVTKAEGDEWRLNNNYTAYAARMAMDRVPELRGFFDVRETKGS